MSVNLWSRRRAVVGMAAGAVGAVSGLMVWRAAHAQSTREIEVVAQRFKFTPSVIELKLNQPVLLLIRSLDFIHGFHVPDMGIRSDLLPGMVTPIRLTPTQQGRIDFLCDNFCGDGHEEMHGHFNVTD
jgi:cytochrome c oxidase subunit 2